jgi:phosphatidate cytidylyltransferase
MHLKRWLTSIVALPLLFFLVSKGGLLAFSSFVGIVSLIALGEFFSIVSAPAEARWVGNPLSWLAFASSLMIIGAAYLNLSQVILGIVAVNLMVSALVSLRLFESSPSIVDTIHKQSLSIIYIPLLLSHLVFLRSQPSGIVWIFLLLCVVFSGDAAAFYAGTYLGRHKLCPAVSPKKTWEGSLGGLMANLGVGALFKYLFLSGLPWGPSLILFVTIGIAGQVGDLFESELKRVAGIKDSGTIVPGHGGMLDRIDALLFAAPIAYYFKILFLTVG